MSISLATVRHKQTHGARRRRRHLRRLERFWRRTTPARTPQPLGRFSTLDLSPSWRTMVRIVILDKKKFLLEKVAFLKSAYLAIYGRLKANIITYLETTFHPNKKLSFFLNQPYCHIRITIPCSIGFCINMGRSCEYGQFIF